MRSTQRVEGMHRTIKIGIDPMMKLYRLVQLHEQVIMEQRRADGHSDHTTVHTFPVIDGVLSSIKAHAAKVYTRNCYYLLCKEMSFESFYVVKCEKQNKSAPDEPIWYWLQAVERENIWYIVIRHDAHEMMYCCCMKLESVGFPCRHMFAVMKYANMKEIPSGCILRRWTIWAKKQIVLNEDNIAHEEDSGLSVEKRKIRDPQIVITKGAQKAKGSKLTANVVV